MDNASPEVPILDLDDYFAGGERLTRFIAEVRRVVREVGFVGFRKPRFIIPHIFNDCLAAAKTLFSQGEAFKLSLERPETGKQRAYTAALGETAAGLDKPDFKEFWHHGRPWNNRDPAEARMRSQCGENVMVPEIPGFDAAMANTYSAFDKEKELILEVFSLVLGLRKNALSRFSAHGDDLMRVIHYLPGDPGKPALWAGPHGDICMLTILAADTESGLFLQNRQGVWIPVRIPSGCIMVNTGEMMTRITGGHLPATIHKVERPENTTGERFSIVYFIHPPRWRMLSYKAQAAFGDPLQKFEAVAEGYALDERLIENGQFAGPNRYTKGGRYVFAA